MLSAKSKVGAMMKPPHRRDDLHYARHPGALPNASLDKPCDIGARLKSIFNKVLRREEEVGLSQQPLNAKELIMWDWQRCLNQRGSMLQCFEVIREEFGCHFVQISECKKCAGDGLLESIRPVFVETLGIVRAGHKLVFAKSICRLPRPDS